MDKAAEEAADFHKPRQRTPSSSQYSSQHVHNNFPLMCSDSGLYTCSSNNSDTAFESDTDSSHISSKLKRDDSLHTVLKDVNKLRSELERLSKSEQWYRQELRQQKASRLEDLERIYSRERKYMEENQKLQKECLRLYEKCSELEREAETYQEASKNDCELRKDVSIIDSNSTDFQIQQQLSIISDQQKLIAVLRKQKKALLNDFKTLTDEKDEQIMKMQKCLADLEFDNKCITKRCAEFSKERYQMDCRLVESETRLSLALTDKLNLQKSLVTLKEQLEIQEKLVKFKEEEITQIQSKFRDTISNEHDLDEVHRLSLKYNEDINSKSLEIIDLKNRISSLEVELENLQELQAQHEQQQRLIEQLNFSLDSCQLELQEIRESDRLQAKQIDELQYKNQILIQEKENSLMEALKQKRNFENICQELKSTKDQFASLQQLYKETKFKLELCEMEQSKLKFQRENDQREIQELRQKLKEYLQQTANLVEKMQKLENQLKQSVEENVQMKKEFEAIQAELSVVIPHSQEASKGDNNCNNFVELSKEFMPHQDALDSHGSNIMAMAIEDCPFDPQGHRTSDRDADLRYQYTKLQENINIFECVLDKNKKILRYLRGDGEEIHDLENLLDENNALKQRIVEIENEARTLKLEQDIRDMTQKCLSLQELLEEQDKKVGDLQIRLLSNDSHLYKAEKNVEVLQENKTLRDHIFLENRELKANLDKEICVKATLKKQLEESRNRLETMKQKLEELKSSKPAKSHQAVQCDIESQEETYQEVKYLREQIEDLQNKQEQFLQNDSLKSEERMQILRKLSDLQSSKIQCLQDNQSDWEDMLNSLRNVQLLEEQTRKDLELKRMELEDLNEVFAEQNEELKKLEELAAIQEIRRQREKEQIKRAFQDEVTTLNKQLLQCQDEIQKQQEINEILQEQNKRIQQNYDEDYATEIGDYKKEVRSLNTQLEKTIQERDELTNRVRELENELHEIKMTRREAVFLPQLTFGNENNSDNKIVQCSDNEKQVQDDHIRILTKVLEAEYVRKMQRYDEHIHSLLANVSALKKSLKANEHKTVMLCEEQYRAKQELKEMQNTKRNLEELRLKYEKSQNIIRVSVHFCNYIFYLRKILNPLGTSTGIIN